MLFRQRLTVVKPGTRTDRSGSVVDDWSPAAVSRVLVTRVSVQPNVQDEQVGATRSTVTTGLRVLSQPGTNPDVTAKDRIEYQGLTYEVDGEVARWPDPVNSTRVHHVEFVMVRVTG
ncbi:phage head completion protein [Micromonospora aurantiaca (nom. illeg.)]|uniref:phage head completion protein n=1 Tax=Micromonospora aurantiaca (nom. illeg.) TaxID=47850 RepID=UPI003DA44499